MIIILIINDNIINNNSNIIIINSSSSTLFEWLKQTTLVQEGLIPTKVIWSEMKQALKQIYSNNNKYLNIFFLFFLTGK